MKPTSSNITGVGKLADTASGLRGIDMGVRIRFRFDGPTCSVTTSGTDVLISYQVDGGVWTEREAAGVHTLDPGGDVGTTHTATVWAEHIPYDTSRWNNPHVYGVTFEDITATNVQPWPSGLPKAVFMGDSITTGARALDGILAGTNNHNGRETFSQVACGLIAVEAWQAGYSGSGIGSTGYLMPNAVYESTLGDGKGHWNRVYAGQVMSWPSDIDLVYLAYGANDSGVSTTAFKDAYHQLLSEIRDVWPSAQILCQTLIDSYDTLYPTISPNIADVVAEDAARGTHLGSPNAVLVDVSSWTIDKCSDGRHPSVTGHSQYGALLAPIVQPYIPGAGEVPSEFIDIRGHACQELTPGESWPGPAQQRGGKAYGVVLTKDSAKGRIVVQRGGVKYYIQEV